VLANGAVESFCALATNTDCWFAVSDPEFPPDFAKRGGGRRVLGVLGDAKSLEIIVLFKFAEQLLQAKVLRPR
jgi:hypothetical protein